MRVWIRAVLDLTTTRLSGGEELWCVLLSGREGNGGVVACLVCLLCSFCLWSWVVYMGDFYLCTPETGGSIFVRVVCILVQ